MGVLRKAREYAHEALGLAFCAGIRCFHGVRKLPGTPRAGYSCALLWHPENRGDLTSITFDGSRVLNVPKQFGLSEWQNYAGCVFWSYHRGLLSNVERKARDKRENASAEDEAPEENVPVGAEVVPVPASSVASEAATSGPGTPHLPSTTGSTDSLEFTTPPAPGTPPTQATQTDGGEDEESPEHPLAVAGGHVGGMLGGAAGTTLGGMLGGETGETVGSALGERLGENVGARLGQLIANRLPNRLGGQSNATSTTPPQAAPGDDSAPSMPSMPGEEDDDPDVGSSSGAASSAGPGTEPADIGPLYLPGLPLPVSQEEFDDPGELEVTGDITCSTLYEAVLPNWLPEAMQKELDKDNELKTAFWFAIEAPWDPEEFWTDVRTGFCYRTERPSCRRAHRRRGAGVLARVSRCEEEGTRLLA